MKRIAALALVILLAAAMLSGCAGMMTAGVYKLKTVNNKPIKDFLLEAADTFGVSLEDLGYNEDLEGQLMTLTLSRDGAAEFSESSNGGEPTAFTGTWTREGNKITTVFTDVTLEFTVIENGKLELVRKIFGNDVTFQLEKERKFW